MTTATTLTACRTCGFDHAVSPFGECLRSAPPMFDNVTPAELDRLIGALSGATLELTAEADALARTNRRCQYTWTPSFTRVVFGVDPAEYEAAAADTAWLLSEALGAMEARA